MDRNVKDKVDGWEICLQRNVHMYCHALSVKKGSHKFSIDCEDMPTTEKAIGIWLYNSKIPEPMIHELQDILLKWAEKFEVVFHIYPNKDEFFTNKAGP